MKGERDIYWANLCILNRKEGEEMEVAAERWKAENGTAYRLVYLGDTEEVKMVEKVREDIATGELGFDILVSTRFTLFCSHSLLLDRTAELLPIQGNFPIREEISRAGVPDPLGFFHPLVVLPHYIVFNTAIEGAAPTLLSLEELLDPYWAGRIFIGNTEMPSGQSVLFSMWYLFGDDGLERCVRNWRQKSAPSAARHSLLKGECAIAMLPGVFSGPGPEDQVTAIKPVEGLPVLPSYAAVKKGAGDAAGFLGASAVSRDFLAFYRDSAHAVVSDPAIPLPAIVEPDDTFIFPDWEWIQRKDMDAFREVIDQIPMV